MKMRYVAVGSIALCALFAFTGSSTFAQIDDMLSPSGEATLSVGLATTVEVVTMTASAYPSVHFVPESNSADLEWANVLQNNYSISDHSNPQKYPGYNDCDSWENVIHDGWSATYAVRAPITSGQATHLLDAVSRDWQSRGYTIQRLTEDQGQQTYTRLFIELESSQIQLNVDPRRGEATIRGITDCLPPG